MKKIIAALLAVVIIMATVVFSFAANLGDVNDDGTINSTDALMVLQYSVGIASFTKQQAANADLDGNGQINSSDALIILQVSVGLIDADSLTSNVTTISSEDDYSGSGSSSGGNASSGSSSTPSTTKFDYKQFVSDLNSSLKRFSDSVHFVYDEETDSWTVVNYKNEDTALYGFKYSAKDKVFYTAENAWQRNFGYMETYDNFSGAMEISYDTIRVKFNYDNKEWMMQFWKGQYGLVLIGAELGFYNRKENATQSSYYDCVTDEEKLNMSMKVLRLDPSTNEFVQLFERSPSKTWWLTGFTPGTLNAGTYVANEDATKKVQVVSTIDFDTPEQAQAFIDGLKNTTTILHNSPRRTRAIEFVEVENEEFETSKLTSKYALDENGKTVYISWR